MKKLSENKTTSRKEYLKEYAKKWRKANPEKEKAIKARYYLKQAKKILSETTTPDN